MPLVNYAKEYKMSSLLIGISLLCSHHSCLLAAVKKADNLGKEYKNIFYRGMG